MSENREIFERFNEAVIECLRLAGYEFDLPLGFVSDTKIRYDIKGKVSGEASWKRVGSEKHYTLRFNKEAILNHTEDMIKETIPHEVAHLVCYARPELGKNHNRGWKHVCKILGGNGERCHSYSLTPGRKTKKHIYMNDGGVFHMGTVQHNRLHRGTHRYRCPKGYSVQPQHYTGRFVYKS